MFELTVITQFSAAHQLKMVAEKCENLHGHNWKIEVCVAGERLNDAGVLIDFGEIKAHLAEIMDRLDHKFLNELEYFKDGNPSSENIAQYIAGALQKKIDDSAVKVIRVTAWESDNACATFIV
jgi:6-pyruvoyltetrahydropterin/6-carboxytetrahydropterin synthase